MIKLKRIYGDTPEKSDGTRILVDRLWPRGISKKDAKLDEWLKEIGPSNELRKWFGHDAKKWQSFKGKYMTELKHNDAMEELKKLNKKRGPLTLLYGAKDEKHNQAVVIKAFLEK